MLMALNRLLFPIFIKTLNYLDNILKIKEPVGWNDQVPRTLVQPGYTKPEKDEK